MAGWTTTLVARIDKRTPKNIDVLLERLTHLLVERDVVIARTVNSITATFTVEGPEDIDEACSTATNAFRAAAAAAKMPRWPIVQLDTRTFQEHDAELARPAFPELVGIAEVADLLGVSRQRASELRTRPGFPAPAADLRAGPVWFRSNVESFVDTWTRQPGRPSTRAHAEAAHGRGAAADTMVKTEDEATG